MRKQYHLLPSAKGFNAWDVDKLVEKTKDLPVVSVPLESIKELDETFWYQDANAKPTCRSLAEHMKLVNETDLQYPIILSAEGRVMDGMHRVVKALLLDQKEISAVRFKIDPPADFTDIQESDLQYD